MRMVVAWLLVALVYGVPAMAYVVDRPRGSDDGE
jgi:hypothetical protein